MDGGDDPGDDDDRKVELTLDDIVGKYLVAHEVPDKNISWAWIVLGYREQSKVEAKDRLNVMQGVSWAISQAFDQEHVREGDKELQEVAKMAGVKQPPQDNKILVPWIPRTPKGASDEVEHSANQN